MRDSFSQESRWDPIAEAARTDAVRGVPRFSGALHARVMVAVKSAERAPAPGSPRTSSAWAFSSAAAVLVMVILAPAFLHSVSRQTSPVGPSEVFAPRAEKLALTTPPVRATLASWGRQESALEADLGPTQLAGLDHDARIAARYVLDPLSLPAPRP